MEATDSIPTFLLFAFQGCNARGLFADVWAGDVVQTMRPVTIPLILMCIASGGMLLAVILWWREVAKSVSLVLIALTLACILGFLGYQATDMYRYAPNGLAAFLNSGNYFIAVGEFSLYLLGVTVMVLVSLILVWREVGWETERNLLLLATGSTVLMTVFWAFLSRAVWNCL